MEKLRVGYEMANSWFDPPLVRAVASWATDSADLGPDDGLGLRCGSRRC